jgi:hypothetical protein
MKTATSKREQLAMKLFKNRQYNCGKNHYKKHETWDDIAYTTRRYYRVRARNILEAKKCVERYVGFDEHLMRVKDDGVLSERKRVLDIINREIELLKEGTGHNIVITYLTGISEDIKNG